MKDDKQVILLEALATDIASIIKDLNRLNSSNSVEQYSLLVSEIKSLRNEIEVLNAIASQSTSTKEQFENQKRMNLSMELDCIRAKLSKEDNLMHYYLSPPKILLTTIVIVLLSVLAGGIGYSAYKSINSQTTQNGN